MTGSSNEPLVSLPTDICIHTQYPYLSLDLLKRRVRDPLTASHPHSSPTQTICHVLAGRFGGYAALFPRFRGEGAEKRPGSVAFGLEDVEGLLARTSHQLLAPAFVSIASPRPSPSGRLEVLFILQLHKR